MRALSAANQLELLALRFDSKFGPLWGANARRSRSFAAVGQVVGNELNKVATDTWPLRRLHGNRPCGAGGTICDGGIHGLVTLSYLGGSIGVDASPRDCQAGGRQSG